MSANAEPADLEIYRKSTEICRIWGGDLLEDAEKAVVNIIPRRLFHAEAHPQIVQFNATERGETNLIGANFYKEELFFVPILLGFLVFVKILVLSDNEVYCYYTFLRGRCSGFKMMVGLLA